MGRKKKTEKDVQMEILVADGPKAEAAVALPPAAEASKPTANLYKLDLKRPHQKYLLRDGTEVKGVTTVLRRLAKDALIHWAWKLGMEGKDYRNERDAAANIGTIAHARIEAYLRKMALDESGLPDEALEPSRIAFNKFYNWWIGSGFKVEATELQMVSENHRYGGTCDVLARDASGKAVLIDIKTSKAVYMEMALQCIAYASLLTECRGTIADRIYIVRVGKTEKDALEVMEVRHDLWSMLQQTWQLVLYADSNINYMEHAGVFQEVTA